MMETEKECCGNCRFHKPDNEEEGAWICTNDESYYEYEYTDYEDYCVDYEEKE